MWRKIGVRMSAIVIVSFPCDPQERRTTLFMDSLSEECGYELFYYAAEIFFHLQKGYFSKLSLFKSALSVKEGGKNCPLKKI